MEQLAVTTPFGRRPMSYGRIQAARRISDIVARAAEEGSNHPAAVNKWRLLRSLAAAREPLGLSDRTLGLLSALLSFHPETALTLPGPAGAEDGPPSPGDLVVFPSNRQLGLRANGMPEKTIRRHLAALVEAGLIARRDSPNGKRYVRRADEDEARPADAFGFDLTPLVARAPEIEALAEDSRRAGRSFALIKERISLQRRDVAKLIAMALDEGLPGPWQELRQTFLGLLTPLRRLRGEHAATALFERLRSLRSEVDAAIAGALKDKKMTGNDGVFDRHISISKPENDTDFEPASDKVRGEGFDISESLETREADETPCPLALAVEACPDAVDYGPDGGLRSWPRFIAAARTIRPMLGISPDAWREAVEAMGEQAAAVAVALILQRSEHSSEAERREAPDGRTTSLVNGSPAVKSPGGYLRALTAKAREGELSLGAILMATIGQRLKARGKPPVAMRRPASWS